ncbi:hypothetical protein V494_08129 [Pseudogymnoascus sp. VKM F-4513 (FW-928)]|nr:hypothetical protein V494_08129 [Pseudogymnoascus sp. VKM F-4513 (FW-928)]
MILFDACAGHLFDDCYRIEGFAVVRTGFNPKHAGASVAGVNSLNILQASADKKGKESWATIEVMAPCDGLDEESDLLDVLTSN